MDDPKHMTEAPDAGLRVAVLVGQPYVEQWQQRALASLVAEPDIEITHVVINDRKNASDSGWMTFAWNVFERIRRYPSGHSLVLPDI